MATPTHYFLEEAAECARVSVSTLRRAISDGKLKATKKARRWRIRPEELQRWLETSEAEPKVSATAPAKARSASAKTGGGNTSYLWDTMLPAKR